MALSFLDVTGQDAIGALVQAGCDRAKLEELVMAAAANAMFAPSTRSSRPPAAKLTDDQLFGMGRDAFGRLPKRLRSMATEVDHALKAGLCDGEFCEGLLGAAGAGPLAAPSRHLIELLPFTLRAFALIVAAQARGGQRNVARAMREEAARSEQELVREVRLRAGRPQFPELSRVLESAYLSLSNAMGGVGPGERFSEQNLRRRNRRSRRGR